MGLPYPGGPEIDKLAKEGNAKAFSFPKPRIQDLDFSFSGLKTSFLYFLRDRLKEDEDFIRKNKIDLAASIQSTIIEILVDKLKQAVSETGINEVAIAGGVSANSGLRSQLQETASAEGWKIHIPGLKFTTDNAAMIAIAGYFKYLEQDFAAQDVTPYARSKF